jgi:hypothetical protein
MITWAIFKHHMLEVGLTQNRETATLQTLTTSIVSCVKTRIEV